MADHGAFFDGGSKSGQVWVRTRNGRQGLGFGRNGQVGVHCRCHLQSQLAPNKRCGFPSQTSEEFADGFLTDAHPPGNLALTHAVILQSLNQPFPCRGHPHTSRRITTRMSQRGQAPGLKTALMSPHRARRTGKRSRDLDLVCPALFHQTDHGMSLSHIVARRILCQDHSRNDNHTVAVLTSQQTALVDDTQTFRVVSFGK